jgi:hypothetical protein
MQKAIMVLVERWPVEASAISSENEVIFHFIKREVFAMLAPLACQDSIE